MDKKNYPVFGTNIARNPNYGRPSAKKLRARMAGWAISRSSRQLLRQIHAEIDATRPKVSKFVEEFEELVA